MILLLDNYDSFTPFPYKPRAVIFGELGATSRCIGNDKSP